LNGEIAIKEVESIYSLILSAFIGATILYAKLYSSKQEGMIRFLDIINEKWLNTNYGRLCNYLLFVGAGIFISVKVLNAKSCFQSFYNGLAWTSIIGNLEKVYLSDIMKSITEQSDSPNPNNMYDQLNPTSTVHKKTRSKTNQNKREGS
jgi:hypothetical protein